MNNIKICVYSICKNGSKKVIKFLDSILEEADYVSILDIGSTDDTYTRILNYDTTKLTKNHKKLIINQYDFDAKDGFIDYSKAKNFAKNYSPIDADVLVYLDTNTLPSKGWSDIVRKAFQDEELQSITNEIVDSNESNNSWPVVAIHRNTPYWIWEGIVKEILNNHSLNTKNEYHGIKDFVFTQYESYGNESDQIKSLKKAVELFPDNPYYINHLASEYKRLGKNKEAVDMYIKALDTLDSSSNSDLYYDICLNIAKLSKNDSPDTALKYLEILENSQYKKNLMDRYMTFIDFYERIGDYENATETLGNVIKHMELFSSNEIEQYYSNGYIEDRLALLFYYGTHNVLGAIEHGAKALQLNPNDDRLFANFTSYFKQLVIENGGEVNEE